MARRPEKDYKILKSNNTTYNFLSQTQRHVPDTPLFKPGEEPSYNVGVRGGDRADNGEWKRHQTPDRGGNYASDDRRGPGPEPDFGKDEPAYNPTTTTTNPINNNNYDYSNNYTSRKNVIAHDEHHVPVSPLYRGGGGRQPRKQDYDDSNRQGGGGRGYGGMRERDSSPGLQDPRMGEQVPPYFNEREQPREDTPGEYYQRHYSPPPRWATRRKWPDGDFRPPVRPHWSIQGDKPLLSDRNHLPNSPLYKGSGPGTLRPINRPESISGNMDDLKLPLEGVTSPAPVLPPVNTSQRAPLAPFNYKSGGGLSHRDHVPDSPLYRGGYRPPHHHEEMPDPSYNTTHLRFDEGKRRAEDPDFYRKQPMSSREHDIRDYRGNPMPNRGPNTDRGDYYERDPRNHPWEHPANVKGNMSDPRFGAGSRGDAFHSAPSKHGGALLFIRFQTNEGEKIPVVSQAFKRATLQDTGGRYLGMSKRVYDFGPDKSPNEAIGVFHFPNMDNALKFFQYDFNIRQPDFPGPYGTASMWIVCNAYLPDNMDVFNTFLLSEITLHKGREKRAFFEEFQKKFEQYLYKNGVMPFVVCSYGNHDRQSIRRHAYQPDKIVTCHLFQGLDHLRWLAEQNEYCKFRSLHNTWATEICSVFSLSKEL